MPILSNCLEFGPCNKRKKHKKIFKLVNHWENIYHIFWAERYHLQLFFIEFNISWLLYGFLKSAAIDFKLQPHPYVIKNYTTNKEKNKQKRKHLSLSKNEIEFLKKHFKICCLFCQQHCQNGNCPLKNFYYIRQVRRSLEESKA